MQFYVMSIRDIAVDAYGRPFCAVKVEAGKRDFGDLINQAAPDNKFHLHPEHFELFHLGMFDDETGKFNTFEHPRSVVLGTELVKRPAI